MRHLFHSLYARIAAVFLLLLVVLGAIQGWSTYRLSMDLVRETDQTLNLTLASDLANDLEPYLDPLDLEAIAHRIHELMVLNHHVEIYLLDAEGAPIAYFPEYKVLERERIGLGPVKRLLAEETPSLPFYGDDPRSLVRETPFSVAAVDLGEAGTGYIYVVLGGDRYQSILTMLEESVIAKTMLQALAISFVLTGIVGLILFGWLTRRLRGLSELVGHFRRGDLTRRGNVTSSDEIGELTAAFNEMADTINANVRRLEETDRLRRELIANVSHDLRSPMASMRGYIETLVLKGEGYSPEERRRFLHTVLTNVNRLSTLVEELFELSKLDAKQTVPEPEPFSIAELVQDVALSFEGRADESGVQLRTDVSPGMPVVVADIGMIERVVSNLIENAIRYTERGGEVAIGIASDGNDVIVNVSDTGCGIPPEDVAHVFDRFYRVEKSRSRASGGTGLGLAIVKKILEAHDRIITVKSELDVGTTFEFSLPVHRPA